VVQKALRQRQDKGVAALREVESARLDALQTAIWERALSGDLDALRACARLIEQRCWLHGLVEASAASAPACSQPQTVVLLENDCRRRNCPHHAGDEARDGGRLVTGATPGRRLLQEQRDRSIILFSA
jgi:hypothetical protein